MKIAMIETMTAPPPRVANPKRLLLQVRVNEREQALIAEAAESLSFTVSAWARSVLIAEARKVLRRAK